MYNRYIPQPDGSYRRSAIADMAAPVQQPQPVREESHPQEAESMESHKPQEACRNGQGCPYAPRTNHPSQPQRQTPRQNRQPEAQGFGVGSFLRQLLPKDFDTEDLLIVLLLLLMSGDCREDQNCALVTLALYLFM